MAMRCDAAIPAAVAAGVAQRIVDFAEVSQEATFPAAYKSAMLRSCVEGLVQLTHTPAGKAAIREAHGIPMLAALLRSDDSVVVCQALHAFMGLTIDIESKLATLEVRHA